MIEFRTAKRKMKMKHELKVQHNFNEHILLNYAYQ